MIDLMLPRRIDEQKFFHSISRVNVELKTNVSEVSSVSIIKVDAVNDRMSLMFILVCKIDVSSYWCIMQ
jgi:hypothetical protein